MIKLSQIYRSPLFLFVFALLNTGIPAHCYTMEVEKNGLDMIDIFGDFRFRFEEDWNSRDSTGDRREDRTRARIRARIGLNIAPSDFFEFAARLRSGNLNSQQSPHITIADFSGNSTGEKNLLFDQWFFKFKFNRLWSWGGRNSLPIWKQNELLWDDDVTVIGGFAGITDYPLGQGKISINSGYALLPDGMAENHGKIGLGQLVYSTQLDNVKLAAAGGVLAMSGEDTPSSFLSNSNGRRDYTIWVVNLQAKTEISEIPLMVGLDFMHNSENYSAIDLSGAPPGTSDDDTEGFDVVLYVGKQQKKGDWLAGYSYADIETFAVNASYAQDDWMRWGSATQTRASDFRGHEFRFAYVLTGNWKVLARLYSVKSNNNPEDGNRFRIDFNRKF